jgi:hypothetical protein
MGSTTARARLHATRSRKASLSIVTQNFLGLKSTNSEMRFETLFSAVHDRGLYAVMGQETWREGEEILEHSGGYGSLICSGLPTQNGRGSRGVSIALGPQAVLGWAKAGKKVFSGYGGRILGLRTLAADSKGRSIGLHLVSAYAPIGAAPPEVWDEFLSDLADCMSKKQVGDVLVVGIDANSSIGVSQPSDEDDFDSFSPVGRFGVRHSNVAGERFYTFLAQYRLAAISTFFEKQRYGTWVHPRSKKAHQLDHILTEHHQLMRFSDCGVASQLIGSDHQAVRCRLKVVSRLRRIVSQRDKVLKKDFSVLVGPSNTQPDQPPTPSDIARSKFCNVVEAQMCVGNGGAADTPGVSDTQKLMLAVSTAIDSLEKKGRPEPEWFAQGKDLLVPLIAKRNAFANQHFGEPTDASWERFIDARRQVKRAVIVARNQWIIGMCTKVESISGMGNVPSGGHLACWDAIKRLKRGLSTAKAATSCRMTKADGTRSVTDEEDAGVFDVHFDKLYGKTPSGDEDVVLSMLKQYPVLTELAGAPDYSEVVSAVKKLNLSGPGISGAHAAAWKALLHLPSTAALILKMVTDFWKDGEVPDEWNHCLLKILPKKGDLSQPGNYRGIMLLEVPYKIIATILQRRLVKVHHALNNKPQCGFLPLVGCPDANFVVRQCLKKRREHGLETWVLFLDLVKAFDTVPRELMWKVLLKLGVPPHLVMLLRALHASVKVHFEVHGVSKQLESIIGVKQGDVLGPVLFILYMAAVMLTWREHDVHQQPGMGSCVFRTKMDGVMCGRPQHTGGESARGCTEFSVQDSEFADDVADLYTSREQVDTKVPLLMQHFTIFGLTAHFGTATKDSKTEVLFVAAPACSYSADSATFDDGEGPQDFSNVQLGGGKFLPIVTQFRYLGSEADRTMTSEADVVSRVKKAGCAFGALRPLLFNSPSISLIAKRMVYTTFVTAVALHGCEAWCITAKLWRKLRVFHAQCARVLCGVSRYRQWRARIRTSTLREDLSMPTIDVYVQRRQMAWLGRMACMDDDAIPRRMMTCWVYRRQIKAPERARLKRAGTLPWGRPVGAPEYTWGRGIHDTLTQLDIPLDGWLDLATADLGVQWRTQVLGEKLGQKTKN